MTKWTKRGFVPTLPNPTLYVRMTLAAAPVTNPYQGSLGVFHFLFSTLTTQLDMKMRETSVKLTCVLDRMRTESKDAIHDGVYIVVASNPRDKWSARAVIPTSKE